MQLCPLCDSTNIQHYHSDKRRDYWQCTCCELVFVAEAQRLTSLEEKYIYDQHQNDPNDLGYRRFLSRFCNPLIERIEPNSYGLDFGCGPGPTLSGLLEQAGHRVELYDIYYFPDKRVLEQRYDFITATEVIEHLYSPNKVWQQWLALVKAGGWIGIMTKLVRDLEAFSKWHYKNDLTHVCFYSQSTFQFLAKRDNLEIEFIGNDVILLRKLQQ